VGNVEREVGGETGSIENGRRCSLEVESVEN
jgi:hypothetical protein